MDFGVCFQFFSFLLLGERIPIICYTIVGAAITKRCNDKNNALSTFHFSTFQPFPGPP